MTLIEVIIEESPLGWFQELGYATPPCNTLALRDPTAGVEALPEGCWRS